MSDRDALVEQIQREVAAAAEAAGIGTGCIDVEQQIASAAKTCAPQLADELASDDPGVAGRAAHDVMAAVWGPGTPTAEWWTSPLGIACRSAVARSIVLPDAVETAAAELEAAHPRTR